LNLFDAAAAWELVHDLGDTPAAAIIKHANPCGAAVAADLATAYRLAFECDEKSAFGGIVALNRPLDTATAEEMVKAAQADVGIGAGQQSRVDAAEIAAKKAAGRAKGGASASDAFYPFADGVEAAAAAGVAAMIQPGGSLRDDEVIAAADEAGIAMVMTGERHFLH